MSPGTGHKEGYVLARQEDSSAFSHRAVAGLIDTGGKGEEGEGGKGGGGGGREGGGGGRGEEGRKGGGGGRRREQRAWERNERRGRDKGITYLYYTTVNPPIKETLKKDKQKVLLYTCTHSRKLPPKGDNLSTIRTKRLVLKVVILSRLNSVNEQ